MRLGNEENDKTSIPVAVIILAAGLGTRMKSDRAKVLHEIDGIPMIRYAVKTAGALAIREIIVVIGHQADRVQAALADYRQVKFAEQDEQLGTGHAVMCALPHLSKPVDHVVVLCGDVPLLQPATVTRLMRNHLTSQHDVTILAVDVDNPTGYGRVLTGSDGEVLGIVEEADADENEKKISTVNAGIYCINKAFLQTALDALNTDNAQNEFYLTDIVSIARAQVRRVGVEMGKDPIEVTGVNTLVELQTVEAAIRSRKK